MTIGNKLYDLRKSLNLSQEEVANKLNVSRQTISKWETDQSTPDFDKIAPLCELYEVSSDELLNLNTTRHTENKEKSIEKSKRNKALVIALSTSLYFLGIIYVILASEVWLLNDALIASGFLGIYMVSTAILIYYFVSQPNEETKKETKEPKNKICDSIISILSIITVTLYLVISFKTMAWHITWIIWVVFALIVEIIKLVFQIIGGKNDRQNL